MHSGDMSKLGIKHVEIKEPQPTGICRTTTTSAAATTIAAVSACLRANFTRPRRHRPYLAQLHACVLPQKEKGHDQTTSKLDPDLKMEKSDGERQDLFAGKESAWCFCSNHSHYRSPMRFYPSFVLNLVHLCHSWIPRACGWFGGSPSAQRQGRHCMQRG